MQQLFEFRSLFIFPSFLCFHFSNYVIELLNVLQDEQMSFIPSISLPSNALSFAFKRQFGPSDKLRSDSLSLFPSFFLKTHLLKNSHLWWRKTVVTIIFLCTFQWPYYKDELKLIYNVDGIIKLLKMFPSATHAFGLINS